MYGFGLSLLAKFFIGGALIAVSLGLVAWVVHSIESGAAAKVELEHVRSVAVHNAEKATELSKAYDRKAKAESAARDDVQRARSTIATLNKRLEAQPEQKVSGSCDLDCQLPIQVNSK